MDLVVSQSVEAFLRAGWIPPARGDPRAKMLRPIRKRPNPLNIQSNDAFNRWQRVKSTQYSIKRLISSFWESGKAFCTRICLLILYFNLLFELLSLYHVMCLYVCVYVCIQKVVPQGPFGRPYSLHQSADLLHVVNSRLSTISLFPNSVFSTEGF